ARTRGGRTPVPPRYLQLRRARLGPLQQPSLHRSAGIHPESNGAEDAGADVPPSCRGDFPSIGKGIAMKTLLLLLAPLLAPAQSCYDPRGKSDQATVEALTHMLNDGENFTCAAANLRLARA